MHFASDIPLSYAASCEMAKELFPKCDTESNFRGYKNRENWYIEDQNEELTKYIKPKIEQNPLKLVHEVVFDVQKETHA